MKNVGDPPRWTRKRRSMNLTLSDDTRAHLEEIEKRTGTKPARTIDEWSRAERKREAKRVDR